ncbi:hypothetical protein [Sphingomonas colocasiae]|uniref:Secreted protein n=1 Tax=Sphingomonas colocasiae TaxID=1848973 RepID=A0ABS7PT25_9SPHN|nr:hypothetical protein [Sphingomonas colocasiae]MBY8824499.1 hypothetical protein [Sphingomonas colocasiae]
MLALALSLLGGLINKLAVFVALFFLDGVDMGIGLHRRRRSDASTRLAVQRSLDGSSNSRLGRRIDSPLPINRCTTFLETETLGIRLIRSIFRRKLGHTEPL